MLLEDLEITNKTIVLLDSFQTYHLIASTDITFIGDILIRNLMEETIITMYYRLPTSMKRKLFRASIKIKNIIKNFEAKHPVSCYIEPVIILNLVDLKCNIITRKIQESGYMLDFFIKDFIAIQNTEGIVIGVLYLHDMINLINNKKFRINDTYNVFINKTIKKNKIAKTLKESDNQLINCNYFIAQTTQKYILGAINIDYLLDDFYLVQTYNENIYTFYLYKQRKVLDCITIFVTSVSSTFIVGFISAIMQYNAYTIIIGEILSSINDSILVVIAREILEEELLILYASMLFFILYSILFILLLYIKQTLYISLITAISCFTSSMLSTFLALILSYFEYNYSILIILADIPLIVNMFILNKILS